MYCHIFYSFEQKRRKSFLIQVYAETLVLLAKIQNEKHTWHTIITTQEKGHLSALIIIVTM